ADTDDPGRPARLGLGLVEVPELPRAQFGAEGGDLQHGLDLFPQFRPDRARARDDDLRAAGDAVLDVHRLRLHPLRLAVDDLFPTVPDQFDSLRVGPEPLDDFEGQGEGFAGRLGGREAGELAIEGLYLGSLLTVCFLLGSVHGDFGNLGSVNISL